MIPKYVMNLFAGSLCLSVAIYLLVIQFTGIGVRDKWDPVAVSILGLVGSVNLVVAGSRYRQFKEK